jgi:hypothetical protein
MRTLAFCLAGTLLAIGAAASCSSSGSSTGAGATTGTASTTAVSGGGATTATASTTAASGGGATTSTTGSQAGGGPATTTAGSGGKGGAAGAGGATGGTGGVAGAGGTGGTGGAGGAVNSGACLTDADCNGATCEAITPGGYRVCVVPPAIATTCQDAAEDQCGCPQGAGNPTCANGQLCVAKPLAPFCGGALMQPHNLCVSAQCETDLDCMPGNLCAPAGTIGRPVAVCIPYGCMTDLDCTTSPGGKCEPADTNLCCGAVVMGLYCVYPNGGCQLQSDCAQGSYCTVQGNDAVCLSGSMPCPG